MLTISFTSADIGRTRLSAGPDPLWELVLAIHMLRGQPGDTLFTSWRRTTATALRSSRRPEQLALLSAVTPTMGYFPDFLTPGAAGWGLESGLEVVRATPVATIAGQLARLTAGRGGLATAAPLAAVRGVAGGDARAVAGLTDGMREFYQLAIAPHQRLVDAVAHRDRAARMDALADGGVETLLAGLHPRTVWSDGALRVLDHPDQRIELGGRGLLLVPSYFCVRHPVTLYDPSLPPVLVYPVRRAPATVLPARAGLARLVGGTRAAILDAIGTGCGTTDVARRVGVAPASASEHLGVLRAAGLVSSERNRNRMLHRLTRLGLSLLDHEHAGNVEATPGAGSKPRIRNAAR